MQPTHPRRHWPALFTVVAGLLAVAGCTSDAPDPAPTPSATAIVPPAACEVITAQDAAAALGQTKPPMAVVDTAEECRYPAENGVDSVGVQVRVEEYHPGTEEAAIALLGADNTTRVSGLGDAALTYDVGNQVQYHIWVDGLYVLVALTRVDGTDLADPARTLAETALSRVDKP